MKWNDIEQIIKDNPKCILCLDDSVHRRELYIGVPEREYARYKLTWEQFKKASAYFEDEPFICDKTINGVHKAWRKNN